MSKTSKIKVTCHKNSVAIKKEHNYEFIDVSGIIKVNKKKFDIDLDISNMVIFTSIDGDMSYGHDVFIDEIDTDEITINGEVYNFDKNCIASYVDFDGEIEWSDVIEDILIDLGLC